MLYINNSNITESKTITFINECVANIILLEKIDLSYFQICSYWYEL